MNTSERLEDVVQDVIAKYGIRKSESSSAADNTSECEETSDIGKHKEILWNNDTFNEITKNEAEILNRLVTL